MLGSMRFKASLQLLSATLAITVFTQSATAKAVFAKGDWTLDDSVPTDPKTGTCVASTATYFSDRVIYSLDLVVDKAGTMPLEIYIHPYKSPAKVQAFQVELDRGVFYNFSLLPRTTGGTDTFWNIPRGTDAFVTELKNGNQINIQAVGPVKGELPFSLSGSTATINELQRRCGAQSLFTAAEFEKAFLPPEVATLDVTKLTPDQTDLLRKIEAKAVEAYRSVLTIKNELATLEAQFLKLTQEQSTLQSSLDQLNRDLVNLTNARNDAQNAIDTASHEIAALQISIANQQNQLVQAQAAYQAAYDALKPFIPEHDRLLGLVQADQQRLANAQQNLSDLDQNIYSDEQQVANLQSEESQLRSVLGSRQNDLQRAQIYASQTQSDLNNFNPSYEIQRRMNSDSRLASIDSDIRNLQQAVQQADNQMRNGQRDRDFRARELQMCEGGGGHFVPSFTVSVNDDGGTDPGSGPGPGPRPGPGPGPGPSNPPDCSAQRNALAQANAQLNSAQQNLSQLQYQLQNRNNDRNNIVSSIQNDVYQQRDALAARASQAQSQLAVIQSEVNRINNRLSDIDQNQLPRLQNELSNLRSQRGSAVQDVQMAQSSLANSTNQFDSYNRSVNWDALKARVDQTAANVSAIQNQLSSLNQQVAIRQRRIQDQTVKRDGLDRQITATNQLIQQKQTRLAQVQQLLAPYNQQKADILQRLQAAQDVVTQISREFALQIPH